MNFFRALWFSTGDGFLSSLRADMSLRPECLIAKWSTALSVKHHTKYGFFFSFSGQVIDRKVLL